MSHQCDGVVNLLPGVTDIMSGFNAAKMISTTDQQSKFRILDLSEPANMDFTINVLNQQQTFSTPLLAQVTDVSLRREMQCESVSYTFESFYTVYARSNSFGVGISLPGAVSVAIEYSDTLKRVHQSITKYNQAVGTSTIWWGLYSIQLAPAFQLKLDPIFNSSVNILINQASSPTTDDHQRLYNQFIESYGTHYVSNVMVGGTVHLYTFVNSSYESVMDYEETSQQVQLMFEYAKVTADGSTSSVEAYEKMKETFRKSTSTYTEFHPPVNVDDTKNETEWKAWQSKAALHPVVINRTLSNLADLISTNKQVQVHLQKTIDYYLKNGQLPTFAQVQSNLRILPQAFSKPLDSPMTSTNRKAIGTIPGLDVVGCGFDALMLESKFCILDKTNFSENESWSDPSNDTITYSLPNGFFATNTPESLNLDLSILVTSVYDYFRLTTSITVSESGGFLGIGKKRKQTTVTEFYRRFYHDYYNLVLRLKQIGWYTLSVSTFPYPQFSPIARQAFDQLPLVFNPNETSIWEKFFSSYGTHLVVASNMGGLVWAETWYEQCLTYEHSETWIDEQVSQNFFFFSSNSNSNEHALEVDEDFKKFSIFTSQLLGGTESIEPTKWKEWAPTVKYNPRPISYRLIPLDELLPEGEKRSALKAAIDFYLQEAIEEDREYIAKLESDRDPLPPTQCSRNLVNQTKSHVNTYRSIGSNPENPQKMLCPYISYNGLTCLDEPMEIRTERAGYQTLPTGVGMTLDITTGDLRLPALEFTYTNLTIWTDPLTSQVYVVPKELSLSSVDEDNQKPIAYQFLTAVELSNQWRYDRLTGSWLGGEFGHSQSLLDIYAKYFSSDEAIAITQHPTVLYRLRVENMQLNKYARAAVDDLTSTYNETLYSDFLQTWGTHIVQQSLIGGMHEQQTLFKDCVFSFNGAITPANLEEYLKQDILAETLGNSFYANRRRINVDHKIGGDVTLTNDTLWRESLSKNPALLKIEYYVPWYEVATLNAAVKENLRQIILKRTFAADLVRTKDEAYLNEQRLNRSLLKKEAYVGLLNGDNCIISDQIILESVEKCVNGCATPIFITSKTGMLHDRPLEYFRDSLTGFVRSRVRLNAQTILDGPRIDIGCSSIDVTDMTTQSVHICVKCQLINTFPQQCTCVCPEYPQPSTVTSSVFTMPAR